MRKTATTIILLAAVATALVVLRQRLSRRPERETGPIALGEISALKLQPITGEGMVVPAQRAELSFLTGGQLAELTTTLGDAVTAGQVLARLETSELELQVELTQSVLELQQGNLARLQMGPSQTEIAAAQASYEAAIARYQKLKSGPTSQEIAIAAADLQKAEIALQRAQAAYGNQRLEPLQLDLAQIDYLQAKATYELAIAGPDKATLKQAESRVASACAQLEALRERPQGSVVQAAQASVIRAEVNLASAERALEQAILRAPFAGTITSLADVHPGEMVQPGYPILTLADLSQLKIETANLDEWGAVNVKLDQTVDMKIPAQSSRSLRGRLVFVSAEPIARSADSVFYEATIALDAQDPGLRWGTKVQITFGQPDPHLIMAATAE